MFGSLSTGVTILTTLLMKIKLAADDASLINLRIPKFFKPHSILTISGMPSASALPPVDAENGSPFHLLIGILLLALCIGSGPLIKRRVQPAGCTKMIGRGIKSCVSGLFSTVMGQRNSLDPKASDFTTLTSQSSPAMIQSMADNSIAIQQSIRVKDLELIKMQLEEKAKLQAEESKHKDKAISIQKMELDRMTEAISNQKTDLDHITQLLTLSEAKNKQLEISSAREKANLESAHEDEMEHFKRHEKTQKTAHDDEIKHSERQRKDLERSTKKAKNQRDELRLFISSLQTKGLVRSRSGDESLLIPPLPANCDRTYFGKFFDARAKRDQLSKDLAKTRALNKRLVDGITVNGALNDKLEETLKSRTEECEAAKAVHNNTINDLQQSYDHDTCLLECELRWAKNAHNKEILELEDKKRSALLLSELQHESDLAALKSEHLKGEKQWRERCNMIRTGLENSSTLKVALLGSALRDARSKVDDVKGEADKRVAEHYEAARKELAASRVELSQLQEANNNLRTRAETAEGKVVKTTASLKEKDDIMAQLERALAVVQKDAAGLKAAAVKSASKADDELVDKTMDTSETVKPDSSITKEDNPLPVPPKVVDGTDNTTTPLDADHDTEQGQVEMPASIPLPASPPSTPVSTSAPIVAADVAEEDQLEMPARIPLPASPPSTPVSTSAPVVATEKAEIEQLELPGSFPLPLSPPFMHQSTSPPAGSADIAEPEQVRTLAALPLPPSPPSRSRSANPLVTTADKEIIGSFKLVSPPEEIPGKDCGAASDSASAPKAPVICAEGIPSRPANGSGGSLKPAPTTKETPGQNDNDAADFTSPHQAAAVDAEVLPRETQPAGGSDDEGFADSAAMTTGSVVNVLGPGHLDLLNADDMDGVEEFYTPTEEKNIDFLSKHDMDQLMEQSSSDNNATPDVAGIDYPMQELGVSTDSPDRVEPVDSSKLELQNQNNAPMPGAYMDWLDPDPQDVGGQQSTDIPDLSTSTAIDQEMIGSDGLLPIDHDTFTDMMAQLDVPSIPQDDSPEEASNQMDESADNFHEHHADGVPPSQVPIPNFPQYQLPQFHPPSQSAGSTLTPPLSLNPCQIDFSDPEIIKIIEDFGASIDQNNNAASQQPTQASLNFGTPADAGGEAPFQFGQQAPPPTTPPPQEHARMIRDIPRRLRRPAGLIPFEVAPTDPLMPNHQPPPAPLPLIVNIVDDNNDNNEPRYPDSSDEDAEGDTDDESDIEWEDTFGLREIHAANPAEEIEAAYSDRGAGPSEEMKNAFKKAGEELKVQESAERSTVGKKREAEGVQSARRYTDDDGAEEDTGRCGGGIVRC
ncbi:MAG: hypothetical protein Q9222_006788 [Ikaeria aurantiellina]